MLIGAVVGGGVYWSALWFVGEYWKFTHPAGRFRELNFFDALIEYLLFDVGNACFVPIGVILGATVGASYLPRSLGSREL